MRRDLDKYLWVPKEIQPKVVSLLSAEKLSHEERLILMYNSITTKDTWQFFANILQAFCKHESSAND